LGWVAAGRNPSSPIKERKIACPEVQDAQR
jgi:hypothetical protein